MVCSFHYWLVADEMIAQIILRNLFCLELFCLTRADVTGGRVEIGHGSETISIR
jgi:hypothetical protein